MFKNYSEKALNASRALAILAVTAAPISTAVASVASVLLILVWLGSGRAITTLSMSWQHPLGKIIVVFYGWLLIGAFYADTEWPAKLATLSSWQKLAFTFLLLGLFQSGLWKKRFLYVFVGVMSLAALISLGYWLADVPFIAKRGGPGILMSNHSAQSMAFIAAFLGGLMLLKDNPPKSLHLLLWLGLVLLIFNVFFISTARSAYIAMPVAVTFALVSIYGRRKLPHIVAACSLGFALVIGASGTIHKRFDQAVTEAGQASTDTSSPETPVGARVVFYKTALELVKEKPVFGFGTSGFKSAYLAHLEQDHPSWAETSDPHNQYLFVWVENGLIGLLIFLAYIVIGMRAGLAAPPYGLAAASFLLAIAVSSLFNSHFKTFVEGNLLAFFLAILVSKASDRPGPA